MGSLLERIGRAKLSRRDFLRGSAAAVTAIAAAGCTQPTGKDNTLAETAKTTEAAGTETAAQQQKTTEVMTEPTPYICESDLAITEGQGKWITGECWHNCGGRCINKAYVVDGVVIRQKTNDDHPDTPEMPQQRSCLRGHSQQQQVFNADRIKYPMKRKNWQPGGGDNAKGELRGEDTWEKISWDEALDLVASELKRVYENYDPRSVVCLGDANDGLLHMMGGCTRGDGVRSYGHWYLSPVDMGTTMSKYNPDMTTANDRTDLVNADTIVLYGMNPAWANGGSPSYHFCLAKEEGVQFVFVGPSYNVSCSMLQAKWIRVRPGTDTAFLLAVAYEMLRLEEEEGGIIDWDFLHKYSVGFDEESMPEDAALNENFKDYVLGKYDDQPKTPEWATEICGTPVEDITWYARTVGMKDNVTLLHSYSPARYNGAEDLPQLFMTIGCMGGHYGRPGNACGGAYHFEAANSGTDLILFGRPSKFGYVPSPIDKTEICEPELWKSMLEGKYTYRGTIGLGSQHNNFQPEEVIEFDPKMLWSYMNNWVQSTMDINTAIRAIKKLEVVVAFDYRSTLSTHYADIVLPVMTAWEGNLDKSQGELCLGKGFNSQSATWRNRDFALIPSPVCQPLYEAKSDQWIHEELMKKLGLDTSLLYPISAVQIWYDALAGATVVGEDGVTPQLLVTITQEDIDAWDVVGEPQEGVIGLKELIEQGYYQVPRKAGDPYGFIAYKDFIEDPEANPRDSASGKFEIYCQHKADSINLIGFAKEPLKPYPTYHRPKMGYEDSFSDWEKKVKGKYPYQMYQPHYLRRSHTTMDNCVWLQEAFPNPIFINKSDAKEKGIQTGDTVLVYNDAGKILRHASVISSIMPGCVALPHGARTDIDPETGIDRGGNENMLLNTNQQSGHFPHVNCYNSCLVDFEKYDGDPIPADCMRDPFVMEE